MSRATPRDAGRVGWGAGRLAGWLLLLVLIGGSAWSLSHAWPMAMATWTAMPALKAVRDWQRPSARPPSEDQWQANRLALDQALKRAPRHGELHEAMGYLYLSAALRPGAMAAIRAPYLRMAISHFEQATRQRPMVPSGWANQSLALHALYRSQADVPGLWAAYDRALAYGQREAHVRKLLAEVAFARWASMEPSRQQAVREMLALATAPETRRLEAMAKQLGMDGAAFK